MQASASALIGPGDICNHGGEVVMNSLAPPYDQL